MHLPVPSALRQTFTAQNALDNGVWGLIYLALYAVFLALGRRVLSLGWPSALLIGFAAFCLLFALTLFLRRKAASGASAGGTTGRGTEPSWLWGQALKDHAMAQPRLQDPPIVVTPSVEFGPPRRVGPKGYGFQ